MSVLQGWGYHFLTVQALLLLAVTMKEGEKGWPNKKVGLPVWRQTIRGGFLLGLDGPGADRGGIVSRENKKLPAHAVPIDPFVPFSPFSAHPNNLGLVFIQRS